MRKKWPVGLPWETAGQQVSESKTGVFFRFEVSLDGKICVKNGRSGSRGSQPAIRKICVKNGRSVSREGGRRPNFYVLRRSLCASSRPVTRTRFLEASVVDADRMLIPRTSDETVDTTQGRVAEARLAVQEEGGRLVAYPKFRTSPVITTSLPRARFTGT